MPDEERNAPEVGPWRFVGGNIRPVRISLSMCYDRKEPGEAFTRSKGKQQ
jgi:hypothetical protein